MELNWENFKNDKVTVEKEAKKFIRQCYKYASK